MPVFNDPEFPRPGELTRHQPTSKRSQVVPNAVEAVPLKKSPETVKVTYEPYNPYPARPRKSVTATPWGLIGLMTSLALAGALLLSTFFVQKLAEKQLAKAIHKATAPFESVAQVSFASANVSLFRRSVQLNHVEIQLQATETRESSSILIDRVKVWGLDWKSLQQMASSRKVALPEALKFAVDGVHIPAESFGPQAQAVLQGMGYNQLSISAYLDLAMNAHKHTFDLRHLQVRMPRAGQLDVSLSLNDFTLPSKAEIAQLEADPKSILTETANYTKASLRGFEVTYQDKTLAQRISNALERAGESSPLTLAQMALQLNSGKPTPRGPASVGIDRVKPALETLVSFLQTPSAITLSANPTKPVQLFHLFDGNASGSINELAQKLNMTVE
jgi:hypothetical protein